MIKYIILSVTSDINLRAGTTKLKVMSNDTPVDLNTDFIARYFKAVWLDPADESKKELWFKWNSRQAAEDAIAFLSKRGYEGLVSYGIEEDIE